MQKYIKTYYLKNIKRKFLHIMIFFCRDFVFLSFLDLKRRIFLNINQTLMILKNKQKLLTILVWPALRQFIISLIYNRFNL